MTKRTAVLILILFAPLYAYGSVHPRTGRTFDPLLDLETRMERRALIQAHWYQLLDSIAYVARDAETDQIVQFIKQNYALAGIDGDVVYRDDPGNSASNLFLVVLPEELPYLDPPPEDAVMFIPGVIRVARDLKPDDLNEGVKMLLIARQQMLETTSVMRRPPELQSSQMEFATRIFKKLKE